MFKKILLVICGCVGLVLILAAFQPKEMFVSREIVIAATPETIFPYINNAQKAYEWMPWAEGDPSIQLTYSGPAEGVGAQSVWSGKEMGVGRSEVVESVPNQLVKTKLEYTEPFEMSQMADLALTPNGDGTLVKWSVSGNQTYFFRVIGLFMSCDKMIGGEFEKGLSKLKAITESK